MAPAKEAVHAEGQGLREQGATGLHVGSPPENRQALATRNRQAQAPRPQAEVSLPPLVGQEFRFFVVGIPVPQGSVRAFIVNTAARGPQAVIVADNKRPLRSWREAVNFAASLHFSSLLLGPVGLQVEFILPRPLATPRRLRRPLHTKAPDVDKLIRAVMDGLKGVAYRDDSQVCRLLISKVVAAEGEQTGARLIVREMFNP